LVTVVANCDFSGCQEKTLYKRRLNSNESQEFFGYLKILHLDTVDKHYDLGFSDGHSAEYTFQGPLLTNRSILLDDVRLHASDAINDAIDRLIKVRKYKFAH